MHIHVSECDVTNGFIVPNGPNCEPEPTGVHPLDHDVGGVVFDAKAVVIVPDGAVVDVDVVALRMGWEVRVCRCVCEEGG